MMHAYVVMLVSGLMLVSCAYAQQPVDEFVIPKQEHRKKLSCDTLKEKIGDTTKELFDSTTLLGHTIGDIELALSRTQCACVTKQQCTHEHLKKIVRVCAACNQSCGAIHKELATLQKRCSTIGEKLMDNERPFKHASRSVLETSLSLLSTLHQRLQQGIEKLRGALSHMTLSERDVHEVVDSVAKELQSQERMMHGASSALCSDQCLKNT
jgi:chromosome segregation ATPase